MHFEKEKFGGGEKKMSYIEEHNNRCEIPVTWEVGDVVKVRGKGEGVVLYIYTNGFTLINFGDTIHGGIFNNDHAFENGEITLKA